MPDPASALTSLSSQALRSLLGSRVARFRLLREAIGRCAEDLSALKATNGKTTENVMGFKQDLALLREVLHRFPNPPESAQSLYERLTYYLHTDFHFSIEDQLLELACRTYRTDLGSWRRAVMAVVFGRFPALMPTFFELVDKLDEPENARWRETIERHQEETRRAPIFGPRKPWEVDSED